MDLGQKAVREGRGYVIDTYGTCMRHGPRPCSGDHLRPALSTPYICSATRIKALYNDPFPSSRMSALVWVGFNPVCISSATPSLISDPPCLLHAGFIEGV